MIDKKILQKKFRSVIKSRDGLDDHKIMHPIRDWFIGWFLALMLLAGFGLWCTSLFWQYTNKSITETASENAPLSIYRENEINQALVELDLRQSEYEKLKNNLLQNKYSTPIITEPLVEREISSELENETTLDSLPQDPDINSSFIR